MRQRTSAPPRSQAGQPTTAPRRKAADGGRLPYVEQFPVHCLRPSHVVVMDNLAAHKVAGVCEAIRAAKASLMHVPAYSPDLNSIEQAFAKLKAGLRKVGARTREALWSTIGSLLDTFTEPERRNYLANSGHAFD